MTLAELQERLVAEGVDPRAYDLGGGHMSERYTIRAPVGHDLDLDQLLMRQDSELDRRPVARLDASQWHVYYSERGNEVGLQSFDSETEACAHFLKRIMSDLHLGGPV